MSSRSYSARRIVTYLFVGGGAFVTEYLVFLCLRMLTSDTGFVLILFQAVSFLFGFAFSFIGNYKLTFRSEKAYEYRKRTLLSRYAVLAMVNLILSSALISVLVHVIAITPEIAKVLVMIAIACWNYLLFQKYIFKT